MATEIEAQTIRWIAELIGFPRDAGGLLVSGGNMANFVCFLAARAAEAAHVRTGGIRAEAPLRVYASTETHTWIQKAADLFGLGTDAIRWIAADDEQRMDVAALERQIVADRTNGDLPMLVVGTAGTVSTGAVDPLAEIADAAGAMTSGSTSTARTARSPRACPARRTICARLAMPIQWRSIRTSGSMRRSKRAARWSGVLPICCARSRTIPATTTSIRRSPTTSTTVRRTRAASGR